MKLLKWQEEVMERIPSLSNKDLLKQTIVLNAGDDYDGCLTPRGEFELSALKKELSNRLMSIKWIDSPLED